MSTRFWSIWAHNCPADNKPYRIPDGAACVKCGGTLAQERERLAAKTPRRLNDATPAEWDAAAAAVRGQPPAAPQTPDPVAQAVEQWLEMERKARAWDEWRAEVRRSLGATWWGVPLDEHLDTLERVVHPAHKS